MTATLATVVQADPDVSPISGSTVTAEVLGVRTVVQLARGMTPVANDVLLVHKVGSLWFAGAIIAASTPAPPTAGPPVPAPRPPVTSGTLVAAPVATASYRGSWRNDNDDVYQGEYGGFGNNVGCAFYGPRLRSLAAATITGAWCRIRRRNAGGITAAQSSTLWLVTQATRPAGAPTRTSSTAGPSLRWGQAAPGNGHPIPTAWVAALAAGTAGGLAVFESDGAPYLILDGKSAWSPSFTLTINWQR